MVKKTKRKRKTNSNENITGRNSENRPEHELTPEEAEEAGREAIDPTHEKKLPEEQH